MKTNPAWPVLTASIIAGALLSSLTSAAIRQPQESSEQVVERVKKAIKNEERGRAQSGIRHAPGLKPNSSEAHFLAAQIYLHEGARSMAIESVSRAIETQPVYPEAHLLLARCLVEAGKLEKSREEVNIAILNSTCAEGRAMRARDACR